MASTTRQELAEACIHELHTDLVTGSQTPAISREVDWKSSYPYLHMTWSRETKRLYKRLRNLREFRRLQDATHQKTSAFVCKQFRGWEGTSKFNPAHNHYKIYKCLEISLTKEVREVNNDNYKTLEKEMENAPNMKNLPSQNFYITKGNYQFNMIPIFQNTI